MLSSELPEKNPSAQGSVLGIDSASASAADMTFP